MVTPSAPTLGSVNFADIYPINSEPTTDLQTDEEKHVLCDATDKIFEGIGILREVKMDFCDGSITLSAELLEDPEHEAVMVIDVMATKFFQDNEAYIASINPTFALFIHNDPLTKDIRKISDIFYCFYQRYLEDQTDEEGELNSLVERSMMKASKPGFKNFHIYSHFDNQQATNLETLKSAPGEKFKKCIKALPTSILRHKESKKTARFLQAGLDQRNLENLDKKNLVDLIQNALETLDRRALAGFDPRALEDLDKKVLVCLIEKGLAGLDPRSLADRDERSLEGFIQRALAGINKKVLVGLVQKKVYESKLEYLRQVLFLLTFQDAFKSKLQTMQRELPMDKHMLYTSSSRSCDMSQTSQDIRRRLELIETTLSQFPLNEVAMLIPLACRSSVSDLQEFDPTFEGSNQIEGNYLIGQCMNARKADLAIREVLKSFKIIPESFSVSKTDVNEVIGMESIDSYLMGISGLAISPGLMGRLAMRDHHAVYYERHSGSTIPHVSDNFPVEFLMTAAQFYSSTNDDWVEKKCLGYVTEMMGYIRPHELEIVKASLGQVREAVRRAPVEILLKEKAGSSSSGSQQHVFRDSGIKKLQGLYEEARRRAGLPPLR